MDHHLRPANFIDQLSSRSRPLVMAIVNATPDSFWEASRTSSELNKQIQHIISEKPDVIDLGAESTRPGSPYIDEATELSRLLPVLTSIRTVSDLPVSVDTRKASVARRVLESGADLINDVSALEDDPQMPEVLAYYKCPVILMHKQGNPQTMQLAPHYHDVVAEVEEYLLGRAEYAIQQGITKENILLDPGLGFGKTVEHNIQLIQALSRFCSHGFPIVLAHSRKSFIGNILAKNGTPLPVHERFAGTQAITAYGYAAGVAMVRVHDPGPTRELLDVLATLGRQNFV